jgi:hypothetical protein
VEVDMALGTKDFQVSRGDLVRVVSGSKVPIPEGTIAPICNIYSGSEKKYQLTGFEQLRISESELEIVSYVRSNLLQDTRYQQITPIQQSLTQSTSDFQPSSYRLHSLYRQLGLLPESTPAHF